MLDTHEVSYMFSMELHKYLPSYVRQGKRCENLLCPSYLRDPRLTTALISRRTSLYVLPSPRATVL